MTLKILYTIKDIDNIKKTKSYTVKHSAFAILAFRKAYLLYTKAFLLYQSYTPLSILAIFKSNARNEFCGAISILLSITVKDNT